MKIIAICGGKNSKKSLLAEKLASYENCMWVKPFTDREIPISSEDWKYAEYIHLKKDFLAQEMNNHEWLASTVVNGNNYVFFTIQFRAEYNVIIADDSILHQLEGDNLISVKCHSRGEKYSERSLLDDEHFDFVFDYDVDDVCGFAEEIGLR